MDHPDQRKLHPPVHEGHGVHVCHKCGWPFPNPHPSARHRRAHKRICGTVEGYKLVESEDLTVSDEDHLSDEDHHDRTLSPKVLETSKNKLGSGGNWERSKSNKAEDEVFSDAVAEFPYSGFNPGIEERLEKVAKDDPNITQSFKNGGIPDIIQPPSISTDSSQLQNLEVPENTTHQLGSTPQSLDHASSSNSLMENYSDCTTEESVLTLGFAENVSASDSNNIKPETLTDTSQENEKTNAGEDVRECSLTTVGPQTDVKGTGEINVDRNLPDIAVSPSKIAGDSFEVVSEESVGKTSDPVPAVGFVQSEEEHNNDSSSKTIQIDRLPEVSADHVNASIDTSETEVDAAKGIHVLSVPDDTPVVDHPEIMFENFKDDTGLKLDQSVSVDSCVTIMGMEDGAKGPASEEKFSSFQSRQLSEEHNDGYSSKMTPIDHTPEVESADHEGASIDTSETEVDAAKGIQYTSSGKIIDSRNRKEGGNESVHVLSVPDDTPVVDHPEIMVENYKDDAGVKLDQSVSLDSCVTIMGKEDGAKGPASEEKFPSIQSRQLSEDTGVPSLDLHVLENILEQEGQNSKAMVNEVPVKEEADVSQFKVTINEIGAPAEVPMPEMDKIHTAHSHEERESHDICNDSLQATFPENAKKFLADAASNQTTNLVGVHNVGNYENATIERFDAIGGDNGKEATEEKYTLESITTSESAANLTESLVISTVNLPEGVIDGRESREGPKEENISLKPTLTSESANSLALQTVVDDIMDESVKKSPDPECTLLDGVPHSSTVGITNVSDSQEGIKDGAIHGNEKVHAESVGGVSTADETYHGGDVKPLEKTSEEFLTKELRLSPLDAESSVQSSAAVEDNNVREFSMGASGIISDSLEGDNNLVKQQSSASAIDVSVDSYSQTDSLEGNWGSVSVLSILSDAPAVSDAEALPSTDSQASAAEKDDLEKPKAESEEQRSDKSESEEQRSDKSDMFEAPSFMTLVETRDGSKRNGAASDIPTVHNPTPHTDASLQAGWFPSLTHVVNESQGRRKNEEIIAKVTNWSTGKQHTPLKSLLGEAALESKPKSPKSKENPGPVIQKEETVPKDNGAVVTTVNSILGPESPTAQAAKTQTNKEWNSPARYPSEIKREKRKVKGRPYWVQFVCCSSMN